MCMYDARIHVYENRDETGVAELFMMPDRDAIFEATLSKRQETGLHAPAFLSFLLVLSTFCCLFFFFFFSSLLLFILLRARQLSHISIA